MTLNSRLTRPGVATTTVWVGESASRISNANS